MADAVPTDETAQDQKLLDMAQEKHARLPLLLSGGLCDKVSLVT
jgi:hypothetical protein